MAKQEINVGTSPNSRTGDTLRTAFIKINENFGEVFDNLAVLNGSSDPNTVVDLNIRGSVFANDGTILVDGMTGKIAFTSVPTEIPARYQFIARFDSIGDLVNVEGIPAGWTYSLSDNILSLTTNISKAPASISYWGCQDNGELRMRFPTPGYQAICKPLAGFQVDLFLNATVTGATVDQYAYVTIVF